MVSRFNDCMETSVNDGTGHWNDLSMFLSCLLPPAPAIIRGFTRWAVVCFKSNNASWETIMAAVVVQIQCNLCVKCNLFIRDANCMQRRTQCCFISVRSAIFEPENRDWEDPGWKGPVAGWTARQPHGAGRSAGGAVSRAEHQQSPHKWQSKYHFIVLMQRAWVECGATTEAVSLNVRQPCTSSAWSCAAKWSACAPRSTPSRPYRGTLSSSPSPCRSLRRLKMINVILGVPLELLFLPLQVKLELIRQAESFEQVKEILEEQAGEAGSSFADPS